METIVETPELTEYELDRDKPMPSKNHALVQSRLVFALSLEYRHLYDFPTEISLDTPGKGSVPDVAIYPKLTFDSFNDESKMTQMPLCAIEIISASQYEGDMVKKAARYFQAGVKSYWLVNPIFKLVHVFSGPTTYRTFTEGTVTDAAVGISLDMGPIFG
ncbi:MAG: Uma2 family endonuclease [Gemmataceae bacterium]|jgi:Uma2 family endonuclease